MRLDLIVIEQVISSPLAHLDSVPDMGLLHRQSSRRGWEAKSLGEERVHVEVLCR
jgi:hypothetical protein